MEEEPIPVLKICDENIINENKINEGNSINLKKMQDFIVNLDKKICRIILSNSYGTGFLCGIPYPDDDHLLKVLITNNHVLDKTTLEKSEKLCIEINKEKRYINLNIKRKIWTDKKIDYTIVEILKVDNCDDFLTMEENSIEDENIIYKKYLQSSIILPAYMENQQIFFNQRNIVSIPDKKTGRFLHTCNTIPGSSGGPIILVDNFCVIAIHKGYDNFNKKNVGVLLRNIILDIKNKEPLNIINEKSLNDLNSNDKIINDINNDNNIKNEYNENDNINNYDDNYNMNNIINNIIDKEIINKIVKEKKIIKVVFVGEEGIKKARVINQFANLDLGGIVGPSVIKTVKIKDFDAELKFDIWDTAGQKAYRALAKLFYQDADVIIMVYDITNENSFREIQNYWYVQIKNSGKSNPFLGIIANNADQNYNAKISIKEGRDYAREIGAFFRASSFQSDDNLEKLFVDIGKAYLLKKQEEYKKEKNKRCIFI